MHGGGVGTRPPLAPDFRTFFENFVYRKTDGGRRCSSENKYVRHV